MLKDSPVIIEDAGNLVVNPSGTGSIFLSGPSSSGNTTKITSANLGILNITGYNGVTRVRADGGFEPGGFSDTAFLGINRGLDLAGNRVVAWTSATGVNAVNPSSPSAGLCLSAAGVVGVNDGSLTCSNTRDLKVRWVQHATGTAPDVRLNHARNNLVRGPVAGVKDTFEVCAKDAGGCSRLADDLLSATCGVKNSFHPCKADCSGAWSPHRFICGSRAERSVNSCTQVQSN